MKKIVLTMGAVLAFGIASAQIRQPGIQNNTNAAGTANSAIMNTERQDRALTNPAPSTATTPQSNAFPTSTTTPPAHLGSTNSATTDSDANANTGDNSAQNRNNTVTTQSPNVPGGTSQGMGVTRDENTNRDDRNP